jgi:hypothetical protein
MTGNSKIVSKPSIGSRQPSEADLERFVHAAPDMRPSAPAAPAAAAAAAPTVAEQVPVIARRGRKEPISLTLQADMIAKLDQARARMGGLSRPAFIALAVTKFIEQNGG